MDVDLILGPKIRIWTWFSVRDLGDGGGPICMSFKVVMAHISKKQAWISIPELGDGQWYDLRTARPSSIVVSLAPAVAMATIVLPIRCHPIIHLHHLLYCAHLSFSPTNLSLYLASRSWELLSVERRWIWYG